MCIDLGQEMDAGTHYIHVDFEINWWKGKAIYS